MAIYHCHASIVKRSLGHSAVAAAAYAAGLDLYDERAEKLEAYGRKQGVLLTQIVAPDHAPEWVYNRQELWNRAELAEKRSDAQTARTFVLALPHECTDEQNADLVLKYAREVFVSEGMIVDIGIHHADRRGDQRNGHAHLVATMRELDGDQFARTKQREWNKTEKLEYWREQWAIYQNRALEEAGFAARVDHRTLEAQGIDREPTTHMGREATSMERRGEKSDLGDRNREAVEQSSKLDELVNELAAVEAEIALETAKEFDIETLPEEEIKISLPTVEEAPPALSWEEQKRQAQDPFAYGVTKEFQRQIREDGEIKEYGLGRNWYDRTVVFFENLYYATAGKAKDIWQRLSGRDKTLDRDDFEPDR